MSRTFVYRWRVAQPGLTQQALADAVGWLSQSQIAALEGGRARLYLDQAQAIADTLGITLDELVHGRPRQTTHVTKTITINPDGTRNTNYQIVKDN